MPYNSNSELCFQIPRNQIAKVTGDIDALGIDEVAALTLEDCELEEPQLYKVLTIVADNINIPDDLDNCEDSLRQSVTDGGAIAYFAASYCRVRPYERNLAPLSTMIILDAAVNASYDATDIGRFFVSRYCQDESLQSIFSYIEWDDSRPSSIYAQIGGGMVSYFLNEFEARCREASNN